MSVAHRKIRGKFFRPEIMKELVEPFRLVHISSKSVEFSQSYGTLKTHENLENQSFVDFFRLSGSTSSDSNRSFLKMEKPIRKCNLLRTSRAMTRGKPQHPLADYFFIWNSQRLERQRSWKDGVHVASCMRWKCSPGSSGIPKTTGI